MLSNTGLSAFNIHAAIEQVILPEAATIFPKDVILQVYLQKMTWSQQQIISVTLTIALCFYTDRNRIC